MEAVEIPTTVLFEEMMKRLDLPAPTYRPRIFEDTKLKSSVTFYPATRCLGFVHGTISLRGNPMNTLDVANNDAAKQAIKYMENVEKLKDYNYDKLNEERLVEENHIDRIIENNRETSKVIKEKDHQIKYMTKQWDDYIEDVSEANEKVHDIAQDGYTIGASEADRDVNSTLSQIQTGAEHIRHISFVATDVLRKIGKYPYNTESESSESAPFSITFQVHLSHHQGSTLGAASMTRVCMTPMIRLLWTISTCR